MSHVSQSSSNKPTASARGVGETVVEKSREIRDSVQQMGSTAKEMAQAGWESARDTAAEYFDKSREKAMELGETLEIQIRSRPIRAILFAAGIGFVAGMLLKRR